MKTIELTREKTTIVDDEDFTWLSEYPWKLGTHGYACISYYLGGGRKNRKVRTVYLHRLVNKTPSGAITDHINGNKLDNRKTNLRTTSQGVNVFNAGLRKDNKSGYQGVCWIKSDKKWRARINIEGKNVQLGDRKILEDAIKLRKLGEIKYYGINSR